MKTYAERMGETAELQRVACAAADAFTVLCNENGPPEDQISKELGDSDAEVAFVAAPRRLELATRNIPYRKVK